MPGHPKRRNPGNLNSRVRLNSSVSPTMVHSTRNSRCKTIRLSRDFQGCPEKIVCNQAFEAKCRAQNQAKHRIVFGGYNPIYTLVVRVLRIPAPTSGRFRKARTGGLIRCDHAHRSSRLNGVTVYVAGIDH